MEQKKLEYDSKLQCRVLSVNVSPHFYFCYLKRLIDLLISPQVTPRICVGVAYHPPPPSGEYLYISSFFKWTFKSCWEPLIKKILGSGGMFSIESII